MGRRPVTNKALLTQIGASLKAARVRKGLTQEEAASKLGLHHRMMSKYERGVNVPGLDVLLDLAKLFDLNLPSIFSEIDQNGREESQISCQVGSGVGDLTKEEEDLVILYRQSVPSHRRSTIAGLRAGLSYRGHAGEK